VDYFTGKSVTGPAVTTVTNDLSTMPVFLRAGGILPTRTDYVDHQAQRPMDQITLDVATGGTGSFSLYEDEGEGHGYSEGKFARTPIGYAQPTRTLTIGPREGTFPGAVDNRTWTAKFRDVSQPTKVTVNGQKVSDWSYDAPTRTLTVSAKSRATEQVTIGY
jgi:alpha-glucosidase (family GH31 glycosyl hydrolase)